MSTTLKFVVVIIVLAALGGGYYYWSTHNPSMRDAAMVSSGDNEASAMTATQSAATASGTMILPSGTDTSDAALAQDLLAINAAIASMSGDSTRVDASMNDKQATQ